MIKPVFIVQSHERVSSVDITIAQYDLLTLFTFEERSSVINKAGICAVSVN